MSGQRKIRHPVQSTQLSNIINELLSGVSTRRRTCGCRRSDCIKIISIFCPLEIFNQRLLKICLQEWQIINHLTANLSITSDERESSVYNCYIIINLRLSRTFSLLTERTFTNWSVTTRERN